VKKTEGVFDTIAFDTDEALITAALNQTTQVTAYCN
jgi:hypothetical protein